MYDPLHVLQRGDIRGDLLPDITDNYFSGAINMEVKRHGEILSHRLQTCGYRHIIPPRVTPRSDIEGYRERYFYCSRQHETWEDTPPPPPTTWTIKGKPQEVGAFWNMVLSQCIYCKYVRERSPSFGEIMEEENLKIYILNWYKRWRNISLSRNVSFKSRIQTWSPPREGPATEKQKHFPVAYQGHMG